MSELRALLLLAGPIILTQIGQMMLGVVDAAFAGHLGVTALDAVTLGNLWQYGTMFPLYGVVSGLDPLVSQAHGAGRGDLAGRALQRGLVMACVLAVPTMLAWSHTEDALLFFGQTPELARAAQAYTDAQLFSPIGMLLYGALNTYLMSRGIVRPGVITMLVANVVNALLAWALIFGHLGAPALGIKGAGLATGTTRMLLALTLAVLVWVLRLSEGAWVPWSRALFERRGWTTQIALGLPIGATIGLEVWAFQLGTLIAGRIDAVSLAAHSIAINLASVSFMVPLGIAFGASTRVGNLIGAAQPQRAQEAAHVALRLAAAYALCAGCAFVLGRAVLPAIYTKDANTLVAAASVLPIAAAFQLMDSLQAVSGGILRGMGRPHVIVLCNLGGYFLLGVPLAYYLAIHTDLRLLGVWVGYAVGLSVVASGLVITVIARGPRTAKALIA